MRLTKGDALGGLLIVLSMTEVIASTGLGTPRTLQVTATIMDAMCEVVFDTSTLTFTPTVPAQFSAGATVEILPLKMRVKCNYIRTPTVSIEGITYANNARVFLDPPANQPGGNGVGFMVHPATMAQTRDTPPALSSFYSQGMAGDAVQAGVQANIIPVTQTQNPVEQVLWVGLVGVWPTTNVLAGKFKSTLTITVAIP
ncbi:fimbrial protein [Morganella morganii]|uniref:fimbrial protein n=1 Tax=Morganella morganii TaxID=582 RepID=UPI00046ADC5A|nr:fimbrial protein [Morganella morganii]